jgi:hypothetical protein
MRRTQYPIVTTTEIISVTQSPGKSLIFSSGELMATTLRTCFKHQGFEPMCLQYFTIAGHDIRFANSSITLVQQRSE